MEITAATIASARFVRLDTLEGAAVAAAHDDALHARRSARNEKQTAARDHVAKMLDAAAKLRRIAAMTIGSGAWRGLSGVGTAVGTICGSTAIARCFEAAGRIDGFEMARTFQVADRERLTIAQQRARQRVDSAADRVQEASRLVASYSRQLDHLLRTEHEAALARL